MAQSEIRCYCVGLSHRRGPKKELWKVEHNLRTAFRVPDILSDDPLFILMTMYSIDLFCYVRNVLQDMMKGYGEAITVGEFSVEAKASKCFPSPFSDAGLVKYVMYN